MMSKRGIAVFTDAASGLMSLPFDEANLVVRALGVLVEAPALPEFIGVALVQWGEAIATRRSLEPSGSAPEDKR